jgi:hypothetical protein
LFLNASSLIFRVGLAIQHYVTRTLIKLEHNNEK